jgi:hypothetical protein
VILCRSWFANSKEPPEIDRADVLISLRPVAHKLPGRESYQAGNQYDDAISTVQSDPAPPNSTLIRPRLNVLVTTVIKRHVLISGHQFMGSTFA